MGSSQFKVEHRSGPDAAGPIGTDVKARTREGRICRVEIDSDNEVRFAEAPEIPIQIRELWRTLESPLVPYRFRFPRLEIRGERGDGLSEKDQLIVSKSPRSLNWHQTASFRPATSASHGTLNHPRGTAEPLDAQRWIEDELNFEPWETNANIVTAAISLPRDEFLPNQKRASSTTYVYGVCSEHERCRTLLLNAAQPELEKFIRQEKYVGLRGQRKPLHGEAVDIAEALKWRAVDMAMAGPSTAEEAETFHGKPVLGLVIRILDDLLHDAFRRSPAGKQQQPVSYEEGRLPQDEDVRARENTVVDAIDALNNVRHE